VSTGGSEEINNLFKGIFYNFDGLGEDVDRNGSFLRSDCSWNGIWSVFLSDTGCGWCLGKSV